MTVGIAAGMDNGGMPGLGYRQEMMRMARRTDCVDRNLQIAVRTVFKADGAGQTACQFAVDLAFGRPRADCPQEIRSA